MDVILVPGNYWFIWNIMIHNIDSSGSSVYQDHLFIWFIISSPELWLIIDSLRLFIYGDHWFISIIESNFFKEIIDSLGSLIHIIIIIDSSRALIHQEHWFTFISRDHWFVGIIVFNGSGCYKIWILFYVFVWFSFPCFITFNVASKYKKSSRP